MTVKATYYLKRQCGNIRPFCRTCVNTFHIVDCDTTCNVNPPSVICLKPVLSGGGTTTCSVCKDNKISNTWVFNYTGLASGSVGYWTVAPGAYVAGIAPNSCGGDNPFNTCRDGNLVTASDSGEFCQPHDGGYCPGYNKWCGCPGCGARWDLLFSVGGASLTLTLDSGASITWTVTFNPSVIGCTSPITLSNGSHPSITIYPVP